MITWVTVWVLTVQTCYDCNSNAVYQLTYATQEICKKQLEKHSKSYSKNARCDFQQIPVVKK